MASSRAKILYDSAAVRLELDGDALRLVTFARDGSSSERRCGGREFLAGELDAEVLDSFDRGDEGLRALVESVVRARHALGDAAGPLPQKSEISVEGRRSIKRVYTFGRGDPRSVFILGRTVRANAGDASWAGSFEEYAQNGPAPILRERLGDEVNARVSEAVSALAPLPCMCHTGCDTTDEHGAIRTLAYKYDPRASVDVSAKVGQCTVCGRCYVFEASGDPQYSYSYSVHDFDPAPLPDPSDPA